MLKRSLDDIKNYGLERFGTLKSFAEALEISAQNLNSYLKGDVGIGKKFIERLRVVGLEYYYNDSKEMLNNDITIDINSIIKITKLSLNETSRIIGVPEITINEWANGTKIPTVSQISQLLNLVVAFGNRNIEENAELRKALNKIEIVNFSNIQKHYT